MDENKPQPNDKDIKVLRTYTSDMADAVRTNEMSVIKIALAEKEKREQEAVYKKAEGTNTSKIFFVMGGIILIAGAIIGLYFLIQKNKVVEVPQTTKNNIETFISYDSQSNIDVTNINNTNDLIKIINQDPNTHSGLIKALFLSKNTNGISETLTSKEFLSLIEATTPGALTRSLSDKFLIGKYLKQDPSGENSPSGMFLVFQTNDYSQAYASMLSWEKTMLKNFNIIFNINILESDKTISERPWKDIIINNRDVRVLSKENGEEILYYTFVNKNNFVITNNIETLKEVMSRLIIKNNTPS